MPTPNLTPAQARVYWAMIEHREAHGVWPTLQGIGDQLGRSKLTVREHIHGMIAKGIAVQPSNGEARAYSIHPQHMPEPATIIIPIRGTIRAENMR